MKDEDRQKRLEKLRLAFQDPNKSRSFFQYVDIAEPYIEALEGELVRLKEILRAVANENADSAESIVRTARTALTAAGGGT
jgi:predicted  nucleic acid-binding Zn-ribbon protein